MVDGDTKGSEHSLDGSTALHDQQAARQGHEQCDVGQGGGGGACARSFYDAHAALARDVVGSSEVQVFVILAVSRELDFEGKRLPVDCRAARRNAAACTAALHKERLTEGAARIPRKSTQ